MQLLIDIALSLIYFLGFLLLCAWSWRFWKMYVNQKYLNKYNEDFIMLEIKLPREVDKSPFATEMAINSLLQEGGVSSWYAKEFKGALPQYASLEIASLEGVIHFYVRVQKRFRSLVESSFYAQYPGIEIVLADDYTKLIRYHHLTKTVSCWGATYKLDETWTPKDDSGDNMEDKGKEVKMPADFLPIKTYIDYGLQGNPKEEQKIDPITTLLEFMGSIGKGEYYWYQIILTPEAVYNDKKFPKFYVNPANHKHMSLADMAEQYKKQMRTTVNKKGKIVKDAYGYVQKDADGKDKTYQEDRVEYKKELDMTTEEKWQLEQANKKFATPIALATIRLMYVTKKENFNGEHVQNILSFPKPFQAANKLSGTPTEPYMYPWQNTKGRRVPWRTEEMFDAYVEREAFYPHIKARTGLDKWEDDIFWSSSMKARKTWRMFYEAFFHPFEHPHPEGVSGYNLQELATLWHLPGTVATTPSIPRIDSAKGVAPVNLPQ